MHHIRDRKVPFWYQYFYGITAYTGNALIFIIYKRVFM
jgi:hypothetical protein